MWLTRENGRVNVVRTRVATYAEEGGKERKRQRSRAQSPFGEPHDSRDDPRTIGVYSRSPVFITGFRAAT